MTTLNDSSVSVDNYQANGLTLQVANLLYFLLLRYLGRRNLSSAASECVVEFAQYSLVGALKSLSLSTWDALNITSQQETGLLNLKLET